jgi:hypothetical protein
MKRSSKEIPRPNQVASIFSQFFLLCSKKRFAFNSEMCARFQQHEIPSGAGAGAEVAFD